MGSEGLKQATEMAILNANYVKDSLVPYYQITDVNNNQRVGHEFIIDLSEFKHLKITEMDIAKRLIDYSFHPGTMSWPRKGVIMIEPTESESKKELDRFIEAMVSIRNEIVEIQQNKYPTDDNVIKNAPHALSLLGEEWNKPYDIKKALYPIDGLLKHKKFPAVNRVNEIEGDKALLAKPTH
jgi:glycine dehydrogenase